MSPGRGWSSSATTVPRYINVREFPPRTENVFYPTDSILAQMGIDAQAMRFDFLRGLARKRGKSAGDPLALIEEWAENNDAPVRQFRRMIARAQAATPTAPAMLAQIASQARNLLQG